MDAQEFRTKAVTVLRGHTNELESMQTAIKRVVDAKEPAIPNQKDIFKEIADTAEECRQTIEYYDENDPMPEEVQIAVADALEAINYCASAWPYFLQSNLSDLRIQKPDWHAAYVVLLEPLPFASSVVWRDESGDRKSVV